MSQSLDLNAVDTYLSAHLPGFSGPVEAQKFDVGQSNPTYLLKTPARDYVLRRKPPGILLKSAHAVDREFRVQSALAGSDVPVAGMHLLCEDEDVIGSMFYIMDHVRGRNFTDPTMQGVDNATRKAVINDMGRVLAALQGGRWTKQYRASATTKQPAMDALIKALGETMPKDDGQRTLVHGDYRIDNMIFESDGARCLAVLDWELSTIGHPYADLASVIMQWQLPPGTEGRGLDGIDRAALGLPTDEAFIAQYCERRGLAQIDNFGYFLGFSFFRMAAIIQGVLKRALDGNASNPERAMKVGQFVPVFAERGLKALEAAA
jgi:aminoglycoside phosphotransferase (APT) family kinase protein